MRMSKHALLVTVLLSSLTAVGCTGDKVPEVPVSEMKAYTLEEAVAICDLLPSEHVADCKTAASSVTWGQ